MSQNKTTGLIRGGAIQWIALAVLIAAMFSASKRAALPALLAILKFLWPLLAVWLIWRLIKAKITSSVQRFQEQVMQAAQQGGMAGNMRRPGFSGTGQPGGGEVLDLCAQCGTLLTPGHRCVKP